VICNGFNVVLKINTWDCVGKKLVVLSCNRITLRVINSTDAQQSHSRPMGLYLNYKSYYLQTLCTL
jgi:hypothetical protein